MGDDKFLDDMRLFASLTFKEKFSRTIKMLCQHGVVLCFIGLLLAFLVLSVAVIIFFVVLRFVPPDQQIVLLSAVPPDHQTDIMMWVLSPDQQTILLDLLISIEEQVSLGGDPIDVATATSIILIFSVYGLSLLESIFLVGFCSLILIYVKNGALRFSNIVGLILKPFTHLGSCIIPLVIYIGFWVGFLLIMDLAFPALSESISRGGGIVIFLVQVYLTFYIADNGTATTKEVFIKASDIITNDLTNLFMTPVIPFVIFTSGIIAMFFAPSGIASIMVIVFFTILSCLFYWCFAAITYRQSSARLFLKRRAVGEGSTDKD